MHSHLLEIFGIEKTAVVEARAARELKVRLNKLYPRDQRGNPPCSSYAGWERAETSELLLDVSHEANLYDQIAGQKAAITIVDCKATRWPSIKELRQTMRDEVFGKLEICARDCSWRLRYFSENDVTELIFAEIASMFSE